MRGGRLRLSPVLIDGLKDYEEQRARRSTLSGERGIVPTCASRTSTSKSRRNASACSPSGASTRCLRADERGRPELWGRIVPSLAASAAESGEIFVHGKVREADAVRSARDGDALADRHRLLARRIRPRLLATLRAARIVRARRVGVDRARRQRAAARASACASARRRRARRRRRTAHHRRATRPVRNLDTCFDRDMERSRILARASTLLRTRRRSHVRCHGHPRSGRGTGHVRQGLDSTRPKYRSTARSPTSSATRPISCAIGKRSNRAGARRSGPRRACRPVQSPRALPPPTLLPRAPRAGCRSR